MVKLIDKRVERNEQSLLALRDLLRDITTFPKKYLEQSSITHALKSQGSLAKLSDESKGIYPSSINTQKRISQNLIEGGFEALNKLRASALMALEKESSLNKQSNKITKSGLLLTIEQLETEKQTLREDLLLLSWVFEKSLRQGARYALQANTSVQALCIKEQRELLDMLSLRKKS